MTPAGTEATLAWSRFIRRLTDHRSWMLADLAHYQETSYLIVLV